MNNAMDIPNPPPGENKMWKINFSSARLIFFKFSDISLQNIIDKLAEFVSRNGSEFEKMTKIKQQGNPKFSFLYGGEYYYYYQYKLSECKYPIFAD